MVTNISITPTLDYAGMENPLLRLLQLVSPALPVGSYAYSQGLEWAVEASWVRDAESTAQWLQGQLSTTLTYVDVPLLARLYDRWTRADEQGFYYWDDVLFACRETVELRQEERYRGQALSRIVKELELIAASRRPNESRISFVAAYAQAARQWNIPREQAIHGYVWNWLENQMIAAIKLVPLGQFAAQRLLVELAGQIPGAVSQGLVCPDESIGTAAPGLAIASCRHETQYSRLFRS